MNTHANGDPEARPTGRLDDLAVGTRLGPLAVVVSAAANERYWAGAGIEHPARTAGLLYPPLAANLTVLVTQTVVAHPLLQTAQRLRSHRSAAAGVKLTIAGAVTERYTKRDREYAVIDADVMLPDRDVLWTSTATFTTVTP